MIIPNYWLIVQRKKWYNVTSIQIILYCSNKTKNNKYFVAPLTILKQFEQDKLNYTIEKDIIHVMNKYFRIERG